MIISLLKDILPYSLSALILMTKKLIENVIFNISGCSGEQLLSLVGTFGLSEQQTNAGHNSVGHCLFVDLGVLLSLRQCLRKLLAIIQQDIFCLLSVCPLSMMRTLKERTLSICMVMSPFAISRAMCPIEIQILNGHIYRQ